MIWTLGDPAKITCHIFFERSCFTSIDSDIAFQCLTHLGDLVIKVADDHLDWFGRVKFIDCICDFVLLSPQIGQVIILILFPGRYKYSYLFIVI